MEHAKCEESPAYQDPAVSGEVTLLCPQCWGVVSYQWPAFWNQCELDCLQVEKLVVSGWVLLKFVKTSIWHMVQQKRREPILPWVHHPTSWGSKWKRKAGEGRRGKAPFLPHLWTRNILFCWFFCIQCYSVCSLWGLLKPYTLAYTRKFLHTTPVEGWCKYA